MSNTSRAMPIVWRDKTKVLCLFRYWARQRGSTVCIHDAVMIEAEFEDQIKEIFEDIIATRKRFGWPIGPNPQRWELTGYIPEFPFDRHQKTVH